MGEMIFERFFLSIGLMAFVFGGFWVLGFFFWFSYFFFFFFLVLMGQEEERQVFA